ncbi:MBL fold metallo-hydrolase [Ruegeria lacuscaerulensis]|uniref:MBL fold metallo-hydrolase n=1 Tax=Ruegeria lacuscaerulensis TaxID=55218 RepID=UPI0014803B8F|nr:MBL fold metallo-hydrolase [Ruegeria lacuscaerulensis]
MISRRQWMRVAGCAMLSALARPAQADAPQLDRHPAPEVGFFANACLIEGPQSCVLVDANLNVSEAQDLARLVRETGKPLTHIVITHPHPDHYLGLQFLGPQFPQAIVASAAQSLTFIETAALDWPNRGWPNPSVLLAC